MAATRSGRKLPSIRTLWAIAKSPELRLSDEDLHGVVYRETGKESMIIAVKVAMVEVEYEVLVNGKSVTSGKHSFPKGVTSIDEDTARKIIAEVAKNNDKVPANYEFDSTVANNLKVVNGKITVALKVAAA